MKFILIFLAVFIGLVEHSLAQNGVPQSHQRLIDEMIADGAEKYPDEEIRLHLQDLPIFKEISIGPREIQIHRSFLVKTWIGPNGGIDWRHRLISTDAVVIGKVDKIIGLPTCGYNTAIQISVERFIKGPSPEKTVTVKLVSGKIPDGKTFLRHTSEPKFQVGERILIFLRKTPSYLHQHVSIKPCPDNIELWYKTETEDYFEPGYVAPSKFTIDCEEKLDWPFLPNGGYGWHGGKQDLSFAVEEIQKAMHAELTW